MPGSLHRSPMTAVATAAPSPIVYVAGNNVVNVYDLGASGPAPSPQRSIVMSPGAATGLVGIVANRDQTISVLQAYQNGYPDCRVNVESATANGSPPATQNECYNGTIGSGVTGVRGLAITRGPSTAPSEYDYLETLLGTQFPGDVVQRYNGGYTNYIQLPGAPRTHYGLTEASGGHIYVASSLSVLQGPAYPPPGPTSSPTVTYSPGPGSAQSGSGVTNTYSGLNTTAQTLYWGPGYAAPDLYFNSSETPAPMTYDAASSNLGSGMERWKGSDSGLLTRLTITVTDPSSSPLPLVDQGSPDIGPVADVSRLTGFKVGLLFEVSNNGGSSWTPSADFYNPLQVKPGDGSTDHADFSGAFYYQNKEPIVTSTSSTNCSSTTSGIARIDNFAVGAANPTNTITKTMTITGREAVGTLAIAPDNVTLYAVTCDTSGQLWLDTLNAQASGATSPTRSIGPFLNTAVLAMTVDASGNLFAGLTDWPQTASSNTHMRVYAPGGSGGKPTPLRILQNPVPVGQTITGIAITQ